MKKSWLLLLPLFLVFVSGCASTKNETKPEVRVPTQTSELTSCAVPTSTSTEVIASNGKNLLPPVSQEEIKKTFTYEDEDMGVKLKYPGSCFFNKGVFQCSDFTMSIWILDSTTTPSAKPEVSFKDGQTQIKYSYIHNNKVYALMAWYDGQNKTDLEKVIDKIAKSLTFTR